MGVVVVQGVEGRRMGDGIEEGFEPCGAGFRERSQDDITRLRFKVVDDFQGSSEVVGAREPEAVEMGMLRWLPPERDWRRRKRRRRNVG